MTIQCQLKKLNDWRFVIPKTGVMRTEGLIYASEKMLNQICGDKAQEQVANVATLPGIVGRSLAMPDIHWGYGFAIGGVAAFDMDKGIISPGGVGYDINCGVRMLRTNLSKEELAPRVKDLIYKIFSNVPSGVGSTGKLALRKEEVADVLKGGAQWAVKKGFGTKEDLKHIEENGKMEQADPSLVSQRAIERGREQLGTLGAGNHFLEVQVVDQVFDAKVAEVFGLELNQIVFMIHTGSRGLGYQICDDNIRKLQGAPAKYGISLPDRQLVCAPVNSNEARDYYGAMCAGANYAWANRQMITHWVRESIMEVFSKPLTELGLEVIYDIAHNICKFETHEVEGKQVKLAVHRKGATRAFPAGHPDIPEDYREVGQPVLIPGTMGTYSYILVGTEQAMKETWGSTCHGAGRVMSRTKALGLARGEQLAARLEAQGIFVKSESQKTLAEENPEAYKDVSQVVDVCHNAGISKKVARLKPLGVIKG
jgi:tRNA-splicing ligase RtcB